MMLNTLHFGLCFLSFIHSFTHSLTCHASQKRLIKKYHPPKTISDQPTNELLRKTFNKSAWIKRVKS